MAEATKDVGQNETARSGAAVWRAQNGDAPEHDASRLWTNEGLTSVLDEPAASEPPRAGRGPGLTAAMLMRLQATSGNAAVAEWLANRKPAQPSSAFAPVASAATAAPQVKPEVSPVHRPEVENPMAGPRHISKVVLAPPNPTVAAPAPPAPAGPIPIPYPATVEAAPGLEAPATEGETETTAAAPPPAGASDEGDRYGRIDRLEAEERSAHRDRGAPPRSGG